MSLTGGYCVCVVCHIGVFTSFYRVESDVYVVMCGIMVIIGGIGL